MRRPAETLFWAGTGLCALAACAVLAGIVTAIVARGLPALSWSFLVEGAREAGADGGILYQLTGTVILIATALACSAPPAAALALLRTVYLGRRGARRLGLALYAWNGVPSVVLGVFGLVVFVRGFGWGKSWLAGGFVLGMMILPTLTVALAERMAAVPEATLEAAYGLGLSRSRVVWAVILPHGVGGLLSGALLGLARAAGETAPILFTAAVFSGATLPTGVRESPILALPYHIFVLAQDSLDPGAVSRLWAAAFVLLTLVLGLSLLSLPIRLRSHAEARDA